MLNDLISNLYKVRSGIENFLISDEFLSFMVKIKQEELTQGLKGNNQKIIPDYSEYYLRYKQTLDSYLLSGTPDLFVSGKFYDSISVTYVSIGIYQLFTDESQDYFSDLMARYDDDTLLDLTDNGLDLVADEVEKFVLSEFESL